MKQYDAIKKLSTRKDDVIKSCMTIHNYRIQLNFIKIFIYLLLLL